MQAIRAGTADVTVLDAGDVYTAGLNFDLVPFISEIYNLEKPEYYVVAVAKESDPSTELTYLRGNLCCAKKFCLFLVNQTHLYIFLKIICVFSFITFFCIFLANKTHL